MRLGVERSKVMLDFGLTINQYRYIKDKHNVTHPLDEEKELRMQAALELLKDEKEPKFNVVAREFNVAYDTLRSRYLRSKEDPRVQAFIDKDNHTPNHKIPLPEKNGNFDYDTYFRLSGYCRL